MCVSVLALSTDTIYSIYPAGRGAGRRAASSGGEPHARRGMADGSVADVLQRDRASRVMFAAAARRRTVATSMRAARACGGSAGTSDPFVAAVAAAKAAAAALKQQRLLLLLRARKLYVSVVLAGMAEAQRVLGLCLAGLDEGTWQGACTRDARCSNCRSDRRRLDGRRPHHWAIAHG